MRVEIANDGPVTIVLDVQPKTDRPAWTLRRRRAD
jgi:hypothetical protein